MSAMTTAQMSTAIPASRPSRRQPPRRYPHHPQRNLQTAPELELEPELDLAPANENSAPEALPSTGTE